MLGANNWAIIAGNMNGMSVGASASLATPMSVTLDPMGNVYMVDRLNHRIQFFSVDQTDGKIMVGVSGINSLNSTMLNEPYSVAL